MSFEFKLPDIGEGIVEGEIVRWLVKAGERLEEDQPMVEVMTDKATVEISSPVAGTVSRCFGEAGDLIKVGGVLVLIDTGGEEPPAEEAPVSPTVSMPVSAPSTPVEPVPQRSGDPILATPAIRRLAREMEVDLSQVPGTGPGGRVSRDDLERFRKKPVVETGVEGTLPYRGIRRRIGEPVRVLGGGSAETILNGFGRNRLWKRESKGLSPIAGFAGVLVSGWCSPSSPHLTLPM